jgi:hypothetical protein
MTPQEIFDTVAKHLFTQGCRSVEDAEDADAACLYRGPEGRMCAVGVLIPDELYSSAIEYENIGHLLSKAGSLFPEWMKANEPLLQSLQSTHDRPRHWLDSETMRERLRSVAGMYELSAAALDELSFAWEGAANADAG